MQNLRMSLLLLCSGVLLLYGCDAGSELPSHEYSSRAQSLLDKGEHQAALIELKNAVRKDPDNAQARLMMGRLYVTLGDGASAEKELRHASELGVDAENIHTHLARAYLLQGNFQAVTELVPSPELTAPTRAELHALRGQAMFYLERPAEAGAEFEQALATDSRSIEALVGQARMAMARGELEPARQLLEQVFSIDGQAADAWSLLGDLEQLAGDLQAAEQAYTTAAENRVANTEDILNRVIMRIGLGQYDKADADIRQLKTRFGNVPGMDYTEGLLYFAQKRYPQAQASFEKVLLYDRHSLPVAFYLGASYFMQGHVEQASLYLTQFLSRRPAYIPAQKMLAWIKLRNGDFSEAQRLIQPVVEQNPEDVFALNLLAKALMRENKTTEGLDYFRQVVALRPDSAAARMNLGMSMVMSGDTGPGIDELEKAEALYPESEVATIKIIQLHLAKKSYDEALQAALAYRQKHPASIKAHTLLGTAYMSKGDAPNAAKTFEAALLIDPGNITANSGLAAIALHAGEFDKAKGHYQAALEKHPGTLSALMNLAAVESAQGNLAAMQEVLEQAIAANPEALAPRLSLGRQYFRAGQHRKVIELLSPMRAANANNPAVLGLLGESELAFGDYKSAAGDLARFVELVPGNAAAHYLLARAYAGARNRDRYYGELNKVLELDEKHLRARSDLAKLLLAEKKAGQASTHIDILKAQAPDQPGVLVLEGRLASLAGDTAKAVEAYRQAFAKQRNNINLLLYEKILWDSGKQEEAIKQVESWMQAYPEDHLALTQLAGRYLTLGQDQKAITAYTRVSELLPDNIIALNNLAWLYQGRDNAQALKYAEKVYSLAPDTPAIIDTTAMIVRLSDARRATKLIEKALDKEPDNSTFLFHKALILRDAGDTAQAAQIVRALVEQDRDFPEKQQARQLFKDLGGV